MTDRELLELAARAAGIEIQGWFGDDDNDIMFADIGPDEVIEWNPLTDDGDALRLAVKLNMQVSVGYRRIHAVICSDSDEPSINCSEPKEGDLYAATRRAIVRAATEIGKAA